MGRSSALRLLSDLVTFALAVSCEKDRAKESIWGMTVAMSSHVLVSARYPVPLDTDGVPSPLDLSS